MCFIAGANFHPKNPEKILKMMQNRGPDASKTKTIGKNFFAHSRLSIIDPSNSSNQPMILDNLCIVFNGEIYNYQNLINEHKLVCKTKSDTEVILQLYKKLGKKSLDLLDGIFAFCIYDENTGEFFCARDRFGKKPFYYYFEHGKFIFASEIKVIIEFLQFTPKMNNQALNEYLQFFTPITPSTFFENIYKLPAGAYLHYHSNEFKIKKYYHLKIKKKIFDTENAIIKTEQILQQAVQKRIVCDAKVGSLLSGGLDSSLVSSIYSKISAQKIDTFSVGYENFENYDETKYAKIVSKHIDSNHFERKISKNEFIQSLDDFLTNIDEPHADSAAIALNILLDDVKVQKIKVLLSGEGSDELFFGYPTYKKIYSFYHFFTSLSASQRKFLENTYKSFENESKEFEYFRRFLQHEPIYNGYGEIFHTTLKNNLYKVPFQIVQQQDIKDELDGMAMRDFKIWLGEALLTKLDFVGMNKAIEIRAPFLDPDIVQTAFSIDSNLRFGNESKHLIKNIAQKYLPKEIINRKKKAFNLPFNEWLHKEYKDDILNTILEANENHRLFKNEYIIKLFEKSKNNLFRQHIWTLYIFSRWFKKIYL